jgi:ribose transport system ATP-binding protein
MLVGRRLADLEQEPRPQPGRDAEVALEVEHLSSPNGVADVSFAVRSGEVVGLAGLLGSGRSEVLHAIFGADPAASGTVRVHGRAVGRGIPSAVRAGIALVPEERLRQALLPDWSISRNASLPDLARLSRRRLVPDGALERRRAEAAIAELGIRAPSPDTPVSALSGGNAQKVALAKWIYGDPDVVLLDEPTHGVDIGAKYDIVRTIRALARSGKAVILVSSEFEELLAEADRILVMDGGAVVHERASAELTQESLLGLVSGLASAGATA